MITEVYRDITLFYFGGYMEAYRHVNVLVSERIYDSLREASFRQKKSISEIVRQGIKNILNTCECKKKADADN